MEMAPLTARVPMVMAPLTARVSPITYTSAVASAGISIINTAMKMPVAGSVRKARSQTFPALLEWF